MAERGLTDALRRFTRICTRGQAPRPGSNFLPMLYLCSEDESVEVNGGELEALYRAGLLDARPNKDALRVEGSDEFGGIDADHEWFVTPAGRSALTDKGEARDG